MLRFGAPRLYLCSTNLQYSGKKCGDIALFSIFIVYLRLRMS